jgi:WD40 repeat protein
MQADSPILCATSQDGSVRVANVSTSKIVHSFFHPGAGLDAEVTTSAESALFSPTTQHWLASGATDGSVRIWDLNSGQGRASMDAGSGVIKLLWLPGAPHVLGACTANGSVRLWDSRNGGLVRSLTGHTGMILDAAPTPDGTELVTFGDDGVARVFDVRGGGMGEAVAAAGGGGGGSA